MAEVHALAVERLLDAPREAVWRAFVDHLAEWWCPKPWTTEVLALDLRAGGRKAMVMRGPAGEEMPLEGVFLEVEAPARIVFTDAFHVGWIPQTPFMIAVMTFEAEGDRTRYRGEARHWTAEAKARHAAMGFEEGWGQVAAQLEEVARRLARV